MSFVKLLSCQSAKKGNFVTLFLKLTSSLGEKEKKSKMLFVASLRKFGIVQEKKKKQNRRFAPVWSTADPEASFNGWGL